MRWPEIFVIPSLAKIDLTGILTVENLSKINRGFGFGNFRENLPKLFRYFKSFGYLAEVSKLLTERRALGQKLLDLLFLSAKWKS